MSQSMLRSPKSVLGYGWAFEVRREVGRFAGAAEEESVRDAIRIMPLEGGRFVGAAEEASVRDAIRIILSTARGERVMRPTFGCNLHELAFAPNDGVTAAQAEFEVREALEAWEPRIDVLGVQARTGGDGGEWLLIEIEYRVRSTDNRFNLVYPFYIDRPLA